MIFPQWQSQLVSLIVSFMNIYIYIPRKKIIIITKKLGSFYNTHFFCEFDTHSIVIIKYDIVVIICDGSAIQCDVGTL